MICAEKCLTEGVHCLRVLFVDSGASGFHLRYAYDIYTTLVEDFHYEVRQLNPKNLSYQLIKEFRPEILLVVHGNRTPWQMVRYTRSLGVATVLWLVEDPYEIDLHRGKMVESYDFVFTNERQAVKEYAHPRGFYIPWCCNHRVHKREAVSRKYQSDLCFVGMGFPNRLRTINSIAPVLKCLKVKLIGKWHKWGELHSDLKDYVIPVVNDFQEVQRYYNGAKINLNIHRDPVEPPSGNSKGVGATSPNDRAFALAGCGAFQIVDKTRPDLWQYFSEDQEIVGFSDPDDLAHKIEEYMIKPNLREEIGLASQKRAYSEHTFKKRLTYIFHTIESSFRKEHFIDFSPQYSFSSTRQKSLAGNASSLSVSHDMQTTKWK
jgi:spore maturation protein CgeB